LIPLAMRLAQTPLGQNLLARLAPGDELKPPFRIENEFLIVEADEKTGALTVRDRYNLAVYRNLNTFVDGGDCGDEYNYCPPPTDTLVTGRLTSLKVYRRPVQPTLELTFELDAPATLSPDRTARSETTTPITIVSRVSLTPGVPRVDVETSVDSRASDHRLRVHFPTPFNVQSADYDGHFEVVNRPLELPLHDDSWAEAPRPEAPQRAFVDVSDGVLGLMIANRGLPEVEVFTNAAGKTEIALTLLRSVGWLSRDDFSTRKGHAGPALETPDAQMHGQWTFHYAIIPHTTNYLNASQHAYAFAAPVRAISADLHPGPLPAKGAFFSGMPVGFVTSAIKTTEDGRGLLVRGYNIDSRPVEVTLRPWRAFKKAERVNLDETHQAALKMTTNGTVKFTANGHEVVSMVFSD
ncbi:MAG: glycoside hydrolase family 38 C-terminal domain-containing protein, partial [Anaerolineales bacterium]